MGKSVKAQRTDVRQDDVELLELVALGLGNKGIAHRLGVSETAIKKRLAVLMRRATVENRAALVRYAFDSGRLVPRQVGSE